MGRTTKPLSSTEVKHAKPQEKEYSLSDGQGLFLRVRPNGSKNWTLKYQRPFTKKRTNLGFGNFPEVGLADARDLRTEALSLLAQNIDPQEHKAEQKLKNEHAHQNTLEHVTNQWLEVKSSSVSDDHANDTYRSLEIHIFPWLGKLPIHKINAVQTIETLKPLAARGSLETVKRVAQRINEVMLFAVNSGLIHSNPLSGISKAFNPPKKKHYPTLKPEELPELMKALSYASITITTRILIEWQLHTMIRPSEAAGARWDEINLLDKVWRIPAKRMKKKRDHAVPLTPQAIELLEYIRPISGRSEYVFPSERNNNKSRHSQTANMAIKRMGFKGRLVAHGMRALASTTLNDQGHNPEMIEYALAHVDKNETRDSYNHAEYLERRRVMMCWWSDWIEQAASGKAMAATSNILRVVG
jgi:integrase